LAGVREVQCKRYNLEVLASSAPAAVPGIEAARAEHADGPGDARTWLKGFRLAGYRAERIHDTPIREPYGHLLRSALAKRIAVG
jgi:hypothetical protein